MKYLVLTAVEYTCETNKRDWKKKMNIVEVTGVESTQYTRIISPSPTEH